MTRSDPTQDKAPRAPGSSPARPSLIERFSGSGPPVVLDGATGTELERAGVRTGLPLWSTHALLEAPETVCEIHRSYLRVGAEIVTANTFRTQARTLERAGLRGTDDLPLSRRAVELAREAIRSGARPSETVRSRGGPWVAGSLPPLEDCYAPDRVPERREREREHRRQVEVLGDAGVDLLSIETINSAREAESAIDAAAASGLPFVVGFVSWEPGRLLSGDDLLATAHRAAESGALAVGVNCVPPSSLPATRSLLAETDLPLLVSPNLGEPNDETGFTRSENRDPASWVRAMRPWLALANLRLVGGCCGTTPEHIDAVAREIASADERS